MARISAKSPRSNPTAKPPADPITRIEWRDAASLSANDYNPNVVFSPELKLLERSILLTGWVQPVLITADGTIIDGFHRAMLSQKSDALRARYAGQVPCAVVDVPRHKAMVLTIRMNRAKGSHVAIRMADMVKEMAREHGMEPQEIAAEIGATLSEIELLLQDNVFKARNLDKAPYSKAWVPRETRNKAA
jgi:hypothetical protein